MPHPDVVEVFRRVYADPETHWEVYETCEELVDVEEGFHLWRFRHLKTVQRIIGHKRGTGGSSGTTFLQRALELTFFPELQGAQRRSTFRAAALAANCPSCTRTTTTAIAVQVTHGSNWR